MSFTAGLPRDDSVSEGAQLLDEAGIRGISAPTEVLIEQAGVTAQREPLSRLEQLLSAQPGVVRVLGLADLPTQRARGLVLAQSGNAARLVVVFDTDPLAATAINHARLLIASEVAQLTRDSLEITLVVALVVELWRPRSG